MIVVRVIHQYHLDQRLLEVVVGIVVSVADAVVKGVVVVVEAVVAVL